MTGEGTTALGQTQDSGGEEQAPANRGSGSFGAAAAGAVFGGYRLLGRAAVPLIRAYLRRRIARGREDPQRIGERLGTPSLPRPKGAVVWLHAASVGEAVSLLPLIERLQRDWPQFSLLMTSGTVTSARLMAERLPGGVIHQYVPVDLPGAVERFLDHWRPSLSLMVESEFWPNLIAATTKTGSELILLNGRVSTASYRSWRRFRPLIATLLGQFSLVMARSPRDQRHLRDLGAAGAICPGDLKAAAAPLAANQTDLTALRAALGNRPLWLAASTHPGEDEMAGQIHHALKARFPDLLTLLVPRHPNRADAIRAALEARQLTVAQRSRNETVSPSGDIYLADTMGEMGLWYHLAEIVFVGGSLVPIGGHNLLEPAKLGCAVLAGPHTANFSEMTEGMTAAGALQQVADPQQLQAAVDRLLADAQARLSLATAAQAYADAQAGVLDRVMLALTPALTRAASRT